MDDAFLRLKLCLKKLLDNLLGGLSELFEVGGSRLDLVTSDWFQRLAAVDMLDFRV